MATATPIFGHKPFKGTYSMIAYQGGSPVEYVLHNPKSDAAAIKRANHEAHMHLRERFIVRNDAGAVIYNGPVLDAMRRPIYFLERRAFTASMPGYAELALEAEGRAAA